MRTSRFSLHHVLIVLSLVVTGVFFFGSSANPVSSQFGGGSMPDPGNGFPPVPSCAPICQLPECKNFGELDTCANLCPEPWKELHTEGPVEDCAGLCVVDAFQGGADACLENVDTTPHDDETLCEAGETKCGLGPTIQTRMHNNGGPHYVLTCMPDGKGWKSQACPQNTKCTVINGDAGCSW